MRKKKMVENIERLWSKYETLKKQMACCKHDFVFEGVIYSTFDLLIEKYVFRCKHCGTESKKVESRLTAKQKDGLKKLGIP